ncbi:cyclopropane-fatty-acyl-phospholipid synthase family protein [Oryzifoliimicrobium ureilyticus]|uniref:cyclopropane-fatty-acyl-phospholipid synthase family protein n=1 Tax=Oryzifoliimicrobium ureilyticus TaxID=3113724 RepID=UPI003075FCC2
MSQFEDFSSASAKLSTDQRNRGFAAMIFGRMLRNVHSGHIRITLPSGVTIEKRGLQAGPEALIVVRRWRALKRLVTAGDIGFAEGYIDGDWTTPDLTSVIRFAAKNVESLNSAMRGSAPARMFNRLLHLLNANTKRGSRRNIEAHYDLGNNFYSQWLDPSMLYSSALYDRSTVSLEAAQQNKLALISEKLAVDPGDRVLEIGCGWGALASYLASNAKASVTGITLSPSQLAWAERVVAEQGLQDQVDLRLQDYRDTNGQFDRIVSIEMFEAVGEKYWPTYFETIRRCLKPGGRAVLQIISIREDRFEGYRNSADFIQKYVFPGGFLPSDSALDVAVSRAGLKLRETFHFGKSYARTLAEWRSRFFANWPHIAAQGFDTKFRRLWDYYLCYCEAGFEEETINVGLYTITHA